MRKVLVVLGSIALLANACALDASGLGGDGELPSPLMHDGGDVRDARDEHDVRDGEALDAPSLFPTERDDG